ncbi:MAG: hypothetical protein LBT39_07810, partial [Treponema sp.]|nr:hypothetical protein [Treponema sp.]
TSFSDGAAQPDRNGLLHRRQRRRRWDELFNPGELAIAGLIAVLLLLFNPSDMGRGAQFLLFWFCAWLSGKKNNPLITLSVVLGVVAVNLLAPYGRVLAEIGPLHITQGSLIAGLHKAITLEGLLMLSGAVIRPNLGGAAGGGVSSASRGASFGRLLGESLAVFGTISESRLRVRPAHFFEDVDDLLLRLDGGAPPGPASGVTVPGAPGWTGRALLALGLLVIAVLTVLPG